MSRFRERAAILTGGDTGIARRNPFPTHSSPAAFFDPRSHSASLYSHNPRCGRDCATLAVHINRPLPCRLIVVTVVAARRELVQAVAAAL